jgi:predicted dehydrogenase
MFRPVKTVVLGCGKISEKYIPNLKNKYAIIDLAGCCDVNADNAKKKAEMFGIETYTMDQILSDDTIELVVNLTPPALHYSIIKQLLEAGRNVYSEKVLAINYEEARELAEIANQNHLYLGVAPDTFLGAAVQNANEIVKSGLIGEAKSCHAFVNRDSNTLGEFIPYMQKFGGGIGMDVGIYYITALLAILGPVKNVAGMSFFPGTRVHRFPFTGNVNEPYEVTSESILTGTIEFASGVLGTLHFNADCIFPEQPQLVIYGTEGIVYMANPNEFGGQVSILRKGQNQPVIIPSNFGYGEESRGLGTAEMAWSMRAGRKHRANEQLAVHALEVLHGIFKSGQDHTFYQMESTFDRIPGLKPGYPDVNYPGDAEGSLV